MIHLKVFPPHPWYNKTPLFSAGRIRSALQPSLGVSLARSKQNCYRSLGARWLHPLPLRVTILITAGSTSEQLCCSQTIKKSWAIAATESLSRRAGCSWAGKGNRSAAFYLPNHQDSSSPKHQITFIKKPFWLQYLIRFLFFSFLAPLSAQRQMQKRKLKQKITLWGR